AAGRVINFSDSFVIVVQANGIDVALTTNGTTQWLRTTNVGVNNANWHHVALTFSSHDGTAILYLDGNEVGRLTGLNGQIQAGNHGQDFYLGDPWGIGLPGLIDNVAFVRGAMTSNDVHRIATSTSSSIDSVMGMVNHASLDVSLSVASVAENA